MAFANRVTALLGIEHPIVQGGMQWVGRAELASAVSNAGALGVLTALTQPSPEALLAEIERCRQMTEMPFGVNVTVLPSINKPPHDEYIDAIIQGGVTIVETAGSSPEPFMGRLKAAGITVIHKCTSVRHARTAERVGVDIVSIDGFECAGHPGEDDVPNFVLLPATTAALSIPVIASGGIADGRGLAAAMMLGAEGVNMGTRFLCTEEAPVHRNVKDALVAADERDTDLIFRQLRNTERVHRNTISAKVVEVLEAGGEFGDIRDLVAGARGRLVYETGDLEAGVWAAGTCQGLINDIPNCATLVSRMVAEAEDRIRSMLAHLGP